MERVVWSIEEGVGGRVGVYGVSNERKPCVQRVGLSYYVCLSYCLSPDRASRTAQYVAIIFDQTSVYLKSFMSFAFTGKGWAMRAFSSCEPVQAVRDRGAEGRAGDRQGQVQVRRVSRQCAQMDHEAQAEHADGPRKHVPGPRRRSAGSADHLKSLTWWWFERHLLGVYTGGEYLGGGMSICEGTSAAGFSSRRASGGCVYGCRHAKRERCAPRACASPDLFKIYLRNFFRISDNPQFKI